MLDPHPSTRKKNHLFLTERFPAPPVMDEDRGGPRSLTDAGIRGRFREQPWKNHCQRCWVRRWTHRAQRLRGLRCHDQALKDHVRLPGEKITAADRERWRALTAGELGDDVYRLSAFDLPPLVILGARISVDWFRRPEPLPAGTEPFDWLAFCERNMISAGDLDGQEGEIFVRVDQTTGTLHWRRDDAVHPAIWRVDLS